MLGLPTLFVLTCCLTSFLSGSQLDFIIIDVSKDLGSA